MSTYVENTLEIARDNLMQQVDRLVESRRSKEERMAGLDRERSLVQSSINMTQREIDEKRNIIAQHEAAYAKVSGKPMPGYVDFTR